MIRRLHALSRHLGFSIHPNSIGPGLSIPHAGTIVVTGNAVIGDNCRIHTCVNIGNHRGKAPRIGNNVYIGPGAKIFGDITVGDNAVIGANAVVNKDVPPGVTVGGVPARIISHKDSRDMIPALKKNRRA